MAKREFSEPSAETVRCTKKGERFFCGRLGKGHYETVTVSVTAGMFEVAGFKAQVCAHKRAPSLENNHVIKGSSGRKICLQLTYDHELRSILATGID